jgi:tripartite-type tricarboxylate transporter receptor subunit TctC
MNLSTSVHRSIPRILLFALFAIPMYAQAQAQAQKTYPSRSVRIIVPTTPGGGSDISARMLAQEFSRRWGHSVIVENRPGAGTIVGTELVAKATGDGYLLLMAPGAFATNPLTYKKLPFDTVRDFAPVTQAVSVPQLLVVHPSLPAKTVKAFIALARSRPGQIHYAAAGHGTLPHLTMELFANMAQIRMVNVPYKGNSGIVDVIAGRIEATVSSSMSVMLPHVRAGRLHALGVTSAERISSLPDLPTVAEAGVPGYAALQWAGLLAPARTPRDIVQLVYRDAADYLRKPEIIERLARDSTIAVASPPEAFSAFIQAEMTKWAKVVKAAGIRLE